MALYDDPVWKVGQPLTPSHLKVLRALAATGSRKVAAAQLGLSPFTVRAHLNEAYRRLGVDDCISAFRVMGWLTVPAGGR